MNMRRFRIVIAAFMTAVMFLLCTAGQSVVSAAEGTADNGQTQEEQPAPGEQTTREEETTPKAQPVQKPAASPKPASVSRKSKKKQTRSLTISGKKLKFLKKVEKGRYLSGNTVPSNLRLKAGRTSIRLSWKKAAGWKKTDGYFIFRKQGASKKYIQIGKVSSKKSSFTDKKAKKKNCLYTYCILPFYNDEAVRVAKKTSDWVSGVNTKSRLVNVYRVTVKNRDQLNNLRTGNPVKIALSFPSNPARKTVRWSSSDKKTAAVSSDGTVRAKKAGKAVISARLATGYIIRIKINTVKSGTAAALIGVMKSWINYSEKNRKHRKIIDIYNDYGNLPVGYKVTYRDAWCDTCVSAAAIMSGNVIQIGRECGVTRHITLFKKKKIWIENGSIVPKPGYIIVYNWGKSRQPNNSGGSHIGIVYSVKNGWITTLEGNYRDKVKKRRIPVGWGFIRGYAKPKYKN